MTVSINRRELIIGAGSTTLLGALGPSQAASGLEDGPSSPARSSTSDPPGYDDMFKVPYAHALMNANLATIKTVNPAHPDEPGQTVCQVDGVQANVIFTGISGTKSLSPSATGYGIPAVSMVLDILLYGNDYDHPDCLVLSTIPFPFSAGTTKTQAIIQNGPPANLTSDIASYVIDQTVIGALIAAANATGQQFGQAPGPLIMIRDEIFISFDKAMRTSVGDEINAALRGISSPIPFEITTGDLMAPFLVFSVPTFDKINRTVDIQFNSLGFSTMLRTVDPQSHQVVLGTALSLVATGQGHLSKAGLDLKLNYKFNVGSGLLPLGSKYAAQINAMISKLESRLNKLFVSELDALLFVLGGFPIPQLMSAPQHQASSLSHWADSPARRSSSLIP